MPVTVRPPVTGDSHGAPVTGMAPGSRPPSQAQVKEIWVKPKLEGVNSPTSPPSARPTSTPWRLRSDPTKCMNFVPRR